MGDELDALLQALHRWFPGVKVVAHEEAKAALTGVMGLIENPRSNFDLPLDGGGTVFQRRVWRVLQDIPPGETRTYAEVAERIGAPKAVRAVAQACAANRLAVVIPCHRVARKDGALSGYRWGVARKRALLEREVRL
ncbi:MAG: methylated-DNA--[protein]-cysteine S-methyltransferase [Methylothermaceae bacterium]|nr:methylated-DNA--[protein]-cysteine S-methyltransferase [Methylothermaceae bacterium]